MCQRWWRVLRDDADWWAAALNYVGSIFFMLSAIASFTLTTTGEELNTTIVNAGTFLGAVCFLVGAYVLLPPARRRRPGDGGELAVGQPLSRSIRRRILPDGDLGTASMKVRRRICL